MDSQMKSVTVAALMAFAVACGGDNVTGTKPPPQSINAQDALKSLTAGLAGVSGSGTLGVGSVLGAGSLGSLAPSQVGQVDVSIDGKAAHMFALVERVTYPSGTCLEQLVPSLVQFGPQNTCTPPPGGVMLVLWQTSTASAPPDRLAVVFAELGTVSFSDWSNMDSFGTTFPPLAMYMERSGALWMSDSGTLTSSIKATGNACALPVPPFATSATCALGTFTEAGHLSFATLDWSPTAASTRHSLDIVSADIPGIVENITGLAKPPAP